MPGNGGNPNPPDKPGQRVVKGDNVEIVLNQAEHINQELKENGMETEATVVISAYQKEK